MEFSSQDPLQQLAERRPNVANIDDQDNDEKFEQEVLKQASASLWWPQPKDDAERVVDVPPQVSEPICHATHEVVESDSSGPSVLAPGAATRSIYGHAGARLPGRSGSRARAESGAHGNGEEEGDRDRNSLVDRLH